MLIMTIGLMVSIFVYAQDEAVEPTKPRANTEKAYLFGIGYTNILDTYLSQEKFSGMELRFVSQMFRQKEGSRVSRMVTHQVFGSMVGTRSNSNSLLSAMYNIQLGWQYNWEFPAQGLNLKVGGLVDGTLGGMYNTRNSNNPAQARISLSVDPTARLSWHFHIKQRPFALRYQLTTPLAGLAFSPNYGQSYYEIFSRGNYDHNVVFTSPFNAPQLHCMLTLDFPLWRATFRVGYLGDIRQMEVNSLKYHQYTHAIVLGWTY